MKKSIMAIAVIAALNSCTGLWGSVTRYDPYESKEPRHNYEKTIYTDREKKYNNYDSYDEDIKVRELERKKDRLERNIKREIIEEERLNNRSSVNYNVNFTSREKEIMHGMKDEYNLIESSEDIIRKTKEAIISIRMNTNKEITALDFLIEINKTLKSTRTKSYSLAASRVISNWSR